MRLQQPARQRSAQQKARWLTRLVAVGLSFTATLVLSSRANASERVVLSYQALQRAISVRALSNFAATGRANRRLSTYIEKTGKSPEEVREILTRQVSINAQTLDRLLNTPLGDTALDRVSQSIHTPSQRSDRQAIRSALTLSATDDGRISLIEVIEKYPTQEVNVDVESLVQTYQDLYALQQQVDQVGNILDQLPRF